MVEIMFKQITALLLGLTISYTLSAQSVKPRIEELKDNEQYMALLEKGLELQLQENNIIKSIDSLRSCYQSAPSEEVQQQIISNEGELFSLRAQKVTTANGINQIEQQWAVSNIGVVKSIPIKQSVDFESENIDKFSKSTIIKEKLPPVDLNNLVRSENMEELIDGYYNRYMANYQEMVSLSDFYSETDNEQEANSALINFDSLNLENIKISKSLSESWSFIYDNKAFAYNILLETLDMKDILSSGAEIMNRALGEISSQAGTVASDEIITYRAQHRALVEYEQLVAEAIKLPVIALSRKNLAEELQQLQTELAPVSITKRLFMDFADAEIHSPSKYNAKNPIPEMKIYKNGTIYRILVGGFNNKQPVSTFRGAYPVAYHRDYRNLWCYYIGGYATKAEAEEAQKQLKKHGFRRPEVVRWKDGAARNITKEPLDESTQLKVEITNLESLDEDIREAILNIASSVEISRVADKYIITPIEEMITAEQLTSKIKELRPAVETEIVEIEM